MKIFESISFMIHSYIGNCKCMIWLKEYIYGGLYNHHICLLLRSNKSFVIGKSMICNAADDKKVLVLYLGDKQNDPSITSEI